MSDLSRPPQSRVQNGLILNSIQEYCPVKESVLIQSFMYLFPRAVDVVWRPATHVALAQATLPRDMLFLRVRTGHFDNMPKCLRHFENSSNA